MGFLDSVKSTAQRGKETVERKGRTTSLKMQLSDLEKQRKELAAQLGASLYEVVRNDPAYTEGREGLFQAIENIDEKRKEVESEIARLEAEAAEAHANNITFSCPQCGSTIQGSDLFCTMCGASVAAYIAEQKQAMLAAQQPEPPVAMAQPVQKFCMNCGWKLSEGDLFCMKCGTRVEGTTVPAPEPAPEPEPELEPVPEAACESEPVDEIPVAVPVAETAVEAEPKPIEAEDAPENEPVDEIQIAPNPYDIEPVEEEPQATPIAAPGVSQSAMQEASDE